MDLILTFEGLTNENTSTLETAMDEINGLSYEKTSSREKVALRYIMRQINTAYKNYIEATTISEDVRKQNMRDVNNAMADAA